MREILLGLLLFFVAGVRTSAQSEAQDSSWNYSNLIQDYLNADYVALVKVGDTKIEDTVGAYSIQHVNFESIKVFKGKNDDNAFYAWLENKNVVWERGGIRGFFLKQAPSKDDTVKISWYWLENSGFSEKELPFISRLSDTSFLKQQIARHWNSELIGAWVKIKITTIPSFEKETHILDIRCTVELQEDSDLLKAKKGQKITISVSTDAYLSPAENTAQLSTKVIYDCYIFQLDGGWQTKVEFMFE